MMRDKERAPRTDWDVVRSAMLDERSISHMKDWRSWVAAFALIALMFAYLHVVGWMVSVWM